MLFQMQLVPLRFGLERRMYDMYDAMLRVPATEDRNKSLSSAAAFGMAQAGLATSFISRLLGSFCLYLTQTHTFHHVILQSRHQLMTPGSVTSPCNQSMYLRV